MPVVGSFRSKMVAFTDKHEAALRQGGLMSVFSTFSFLISAANFTKKELVVRDNEFLIGQHRVLSLFGLSGSGDKSISSLVPKNVLSSKIYALENAMAAISKENSVKGGEYLMECYSGIGRNEINELAALSKELSSSRESNLYTRRFISCVSAISGKHVKKEKSNEFGCES